MVVAQAGSMILDRENNISYATISERTSKKVLLDFGNRMNYKIIYFNSLYKNLPIYHTNVMMSIGNNFTLICLDSIPDEKEKIKLLESFENNNKQIIEISINQLDNFAGNILQLIGKENNPLIVMSKAAFSSYSKDQIKKLERNGELIFSSLSTIERYGGGSARCMIGELFF